MVQPPGGGSYEMTSPTDSLLPIFHARVLLQICRLSSIVDNITILKLYSSQIMSSPQLDLRVKTMYHLSVQPVSRAYIKATVAIRKRSTLIVIQCYIGVSRQQFRLFVCFSAFLVLAIYD